jgi:hypothetical protein
LLFFEQATTSPNESRIGAAEAITELVSNNKRLLKSQINPKIV